MSRTLLLCAGLLVVAGCAQRDEGQVVELRQRVDQLEKRLASMPPAGSAPAGHGSGHAVAAHQQPAAAYAALVSGNAAFVSGGAPRPDLSAAHRRELSSGQQPYAAVVACADSRSPPEHVFSAGLGDLFVVRCAGNVMDRAAVASLEYAVAHLGVRVIAIIGHESCGAVKAAIADNHETPAISELVARIKPAIQSGPGDAATRTVAANATLQRQVLLSESDLLAGLARSHELRLVVGVHQLDTGAITWLEQDGLTAASAAPVPAAVEVHAKPRPAAAPPLPAATAPAHGH